MRSEDLGTFRGTCAQCERHVNRYLRVGVNLSLASSMPKREDEWGYWVICSWECLVAYASAMRLKNEPV